MAEDDGYSEYSRKEMVNEIVFRLLPDYKKLENISFGQDPLLSLMQFEVVNADCAKFFIKDLTNLIKGVGLDKSNLPKPKIYYALKKYHALIRAKIRFRERDRFDCNIQSLIEYANVLSQAVCGKPSEYSFYRL
jgi:hypothetical protein